MTPHSPSNEDHDQQLADLLAEITDQQQRGEPLDLDAALRQHPELSCELRQLLQVAQRAECAWSANGAMTTSFRPAEGADRLTLELPRRFADYELRQELGRGGMGVVYLAWDPRLGRPVALKMILRGEHASAEDLARFRGEAQAAAGLAHRNIVPVYDVGEHEGLAYFSMQFVEGQTLAELGTRGPLPSQRAARYLATMSQAVHYAHEHGLLHRDLKPSNVLIDSATDEPLVTDFGLAKRIPEGSAAITTVAGLTQTGALVGTPNYMAPEQASGQGRASRASDVYSLGAILYELLTGRPPFQATSVVEVLWQVRTEEPVRPRLLNAAIDPDLEFICLKCLEKQPSHRYPTALALAEDLQRFLNSEPVVARTSNLMYLLGRIWRETHHAPVMVNWGSLWMWHSLMLFLLCLTTNILYWSGIRDHITFVALWSVGLAAWGALLWNWRHLLGPILFVERQVAHAWAAGVIASVGTFLVEVWLDRPVLSLTPVLAVLAGMVFVFMAGTLSGWFYVAAGLCFLAVWPMARWPNYAPLLFGIVSAVGFFVPGLRYYRQKRRNQPSPTGPIR
jgi:serine/threonine-protein kinase